MIIIPESFLYFQNPFFQLKIERKVLISTEKLFQF